MAHEFEVKQSLDDSLRTRLAVTWVLGTFLACSVLGRSAAIQLFKNPRLEAMANRQYHAKSLIKPNRGSILDRNGEPLAVSVEAYSLAANPTKIRQRWLIARLLAKSIHSSYARLMNKLSEPKEFVWIKRHLSEAELKNFKKLGVVDTEGDLVEGLWLVKESNRVYPHHQLAAHLLGNVNIDSEGLEGVELWQDERMRGKVVSVSAIKDALGRPTFIDAQAASQVQNGDSVTLTLDSVLQYEVEQELAAAVHRTGSRGGVVIVMDAVSGEILSLANEPVFDPNQKGISADRRRNRAITDGFEPGSILKPILLAGALTYGWRLTDEVWGERGAFILQKKKISEAEAREKYEWISLKKMIQVSSNIAAAKVALKLGSDRYLKTLISFGFGARTGLGFPGEIPGRLPGKKEWQPLSLANIGFGQGILVTAIQMARAYSAILNGGWLVEPTLLKMAGGPGKANSESKSEIELTFGAAHQIISRRVGYQVIEAMESVTQEGGTGLKAALPGYRVAGKTGTAQEIDPITKKYSHDKYISSFVGFPVDTGMKIVVFTSLNEPRVGYYASETAAPLFREVLNSVVRHYSIPGHIPARMEPKTLGVVESRTQAAPEFVTLPGLVRSPGEIDKWIMPSLIGLTQREAIQILQGHSFHLEMLGLGVLSSQVPVAGRKLGETDRVRLFFSEP